MGAGQGHCKGEAEAPPPESARVHACTHAHAHSLGALLSTILSSCPSLPLSPLLALCTPLPCPAPACQPSSLLDLHPSVLAYGSHSSVLWRGQAWVLPFIPNQEPEQAPSLVHLPGLSLGEAPPLCSCPASSPQGHAFPGPVHTNLRGHTHLQVQMVKPR